METWHVLVFWRELTCISKAGEIFVRNAHRGSWGSDKSRPSWLRGGTLVTSQALKWVTFYKSTWRQNFIFSTACCLWRQHKTIQLISVQERKSQEIGEYCEPPLFYTQKKSDIENKNGLCGPGKRAYGLALGSHVPRRSHGSLLTLVEVKGCYPTNPLTDALNNKSQTALLMCIYPCSKQSTPAIFALSSLVGLKGGNENSLKVEV